MTTYQPPPPDKEGPMSTTALIALTRDIAVILIAVVYVIDTL